MELFHDFPIRRRPPLPLMAVFSIHFLPYLFLLQLNVVYMKWILHLAPVKNIILKSSYNWFKMDFPRLLGPLTAN